MARSPRGVYCFLAVDSFMRAALPFRSRRKYSLARRTRAERTTSTFAIVGECSGKIRSTPWPKDTFRTVKLARAPPRCSPMMIPSKIWMRSLSPSRTLTCTRTVSPDFMAGRSASCGFSTSSIAPIFQLLQDFFLFIVQIRRVQQVGSARQRALERLALPPPLDVPMVPRQQHVGHPELLPFLPAADRRGPRVLRQVQQSARERIFRHRPLVADDARHEPRDRIENHQRRQLAARYDVI